jgi:hypothetical protein
MTTAVLFLLMLGVRAHAHTPPRPPACLPADVKADDVVTVEQRGSGRAPARITVEQRLKKMKARCRRGKLVDRSGREVRFYRLAGCWGNPPQDYREILGRQQRELDDLKRRYVVVELSCNPGGVSIH